MQCRGVLLIWIKVGQWPRAKQTQSAVQWAKFKRLRNKVVSLIPESKRNTKEKLSTKLQTQPLSSKDWWSTLKTFISPDSKPQIPPLEINGSVFTDDNEKANLLNDFFRDQTQIDQNNAVLPVLASFNGTPLRDILITPAEVQIILKSLPIGKASGPDEINNIILRELAEVLSSPLACLFNQSLSQGIVPEIWKTAHVCPVSKGGESSSISNYRPISLLSNLDKSMERIVFKHLYNHFLANEILTPLQSGFIPGDSTVNQLTFLYDTFCKALDSGLEVRVIFCDISKAFDRVWHAGLIHKLNAAGISGNLLSWFIDYLSNRRQRVVFPGVSSKKK